ncbi:MAG: carbohydrate-binding family 9-like protein [Balneolaceae bacterium]
MKIPKKHEFPLILSTGRVRITGTGTGLFCFALILGFVLTAGDRLEAHSDTENITDDVENGGMEFSPGFEQVSVDTLLYEESVYPVSRLSQPVVIDADWDKEPWSDIQSLYLGNHMGDDPDHRPDVHAKVAYDSEAIYVIFHVQDQYVRCVVEEHHGPVWTDSCVEFFFTPETETEGYFNLETNCIGTALFSYQNREEGIRSRISESDFESVDIAHSVSGVVDPEITDPVTWTLEYRIPFELIARYTEMDHPAPGVEWKANFYKIADNSSHPHWLTWSPVDHPEPNFHLPEFFGRLQFR